VSGSGISWAIQHPIQNCAKWMHSEKRAPEIESTYKLSLLKTELKIIPESKFPCKIKYINAKKDNIKDSI